ncbi:hypothetical protein B0H11DRAFT_1345488 [Mycena galericulata]|nr:hypothetical protein B0H11DRAFT_1345488 [Mycena galericulata]
MAMESHKRTISPGSIEGDFIGDGRPPKRQQKTVHSDPVDRFKIGFITAEHAVIHAGQTAREQSEATNGISAFDAEMISGSTTLRDLQKEAARVLQWSLPNSMDLDDGPCDHEREVACSCPVSREIEQYGLSDTLHCRFTVDGSSCGNAECPYSHVKLADPSMDSPPHCSLCGEALGFPCPPCLGRAQKAEEGPASVLFCPLVKNAGCGHLHHAHCIGPRHDTSALNCPSGCAAQRFPREAVDLGMSEPHLTIVWDGDRIDKIPITFYKNGVSRDSITLSTDATIEIVERFLEDHQFALAGLSLRIHFRDPMTETVRFLQSTLVSVCPSSSHQNQGYRRFPLFPAKIPSLAAERTGSFSVDLHTSHAPIVACGCTPIRDLFTPPGSLTPEQTSIWLYAVKRKTESATDMTASADKRGTVSKESMYLNDAAWQPSVEQTPRGMAALLSSLYLFAHSVAQKGVGAEQKVLALAYGVLRFPPAIRTLAGLLLNKVPRPEEKAALAEALFHALREFSSRGPAAITSRETRRFETIRILLAYIASAADAESTAVPERPVEEISLVCAISRKRLRDPVFLDSALVERSVAALHQPRGALYRPHHSAPSSVVVEPSDTDAIVKLLPALPGVRATSTLFLRVNDIGWPPRTFMSTLDTAARDFISAIRRANQTDLVSQGPLELKSVDVVPPRIVVDQEGFLAVFTGRGCGTSRDVNFFRPTRGGDTEVDVNDVSHGLQKVIKVREAEDTWQVDSFGQISAVSRPPDEAIVLCLDLSQSMNKQSGVQTSTAPNTEDTALDPEVDANEIAGERVEGMDTSDILESAKAYLRPVHLDCHHAWTTLSNRPGLRGADLLGRLATLASRDLLQVSLSDEDPGADDSAMQQVFLVSPSCNVILMHIPVGVLCLGRIR